MRSHAHVHTHSHADARARSNKLRRRRQTTNRPDGNDIHNKLHITRNGSVVKIIRDRVMRETLRLASDEFPSLGARQLDDFHYIDVGGESHTLIYLISELWSVITTNVGTHLSQRELEDVFGLSKCDARAVLVFMDPRGKNISFDDFDRVLSSFFKRTELVRLFSATVAPPAANLACGPEEQGPCSSDKHASMSKSTTHRLVPPTGSDPHILSGTPLRSLPDIDCDASYDTSRQRQTHVSTVCAMLSYTLIIATTYCRDFVMSILRNTICVGEDYK